jgi:hypothetical protein
MEFVWTISRPTLNSPSTLQGQTIEIKTTGLVSTMTNAFNRNRRKTSSNVNAEVRVRPCGGRKYLDVTQAYKVVPMLNLLSTIPWRRMGEWIYRSTFLDLSTSWRWVLSFTSRPLCPRGESPSSRYSLDRVWVDPRAGLGHVKRRKFLTLPGLELRPLGRPTRSQSLNRLRYPDLCISKYI